MKPIYIVKIICNMHVQCSSDKQDRKLYYNSMIVYIYSCVIQIYIIYKRKDYYTASVVQTYKLLLYYLHSGW